jgi:hypothetical protein
VPTSRCRLVAVLAVLTATVPIGAADVATQAPESRTQVVLLGTGNPRPTPQYSGPVIREMGAVYRGRFVSGRDQDVD